MTNIVSPQKCKKNFLANKKRHNRLKKCARVSFCAQVKKRKVVTVLFFCDQNFRWTFLFIVIMKNKNSTSFSQKILKILVERCKKGGYNMKSLTHNYYIIII